MMWSPLVLCLLVSLACATKNPAWNPQKHYVYEIRGRSLASLNEQSDYYSGILYKAQLEVQPTSDGNLGAQITKAQFAPVQQPLEEGWEEDISDSRLSYKQLPLSSQPFQIILKDGAVRNIVVEKKMTNWEANMIKSVVSQLQLDTKATNLIPSSFNILTQDENDAVFKTMEETVSGVAETLYEIHPYPEYVRQSRPWEVPLEELIGDGDVIEVVKTKNYTDSTQLPAYHSGLYGVQDFQPDNQIVEFLSRSSISRAVLTGNLKEYTVQSSVTTEEISLRPTHGDAQQGSVATKLNLTLKAVSEPLDQSRFQVNDGVEVGVVYGYDKPYSTDNGPRPAKPFDHSADPSSWEMNQSGESSSEENFSRSRRSAKSKLAKKFNSAAYQADSSENDDWLQDKPSIEEPPASPLLPLTVGYNGQSIKKQQNIAEIVRKIAQEIGEEFQHPRDIMHQHTVGKFVMLASLVRTMNKDEIQTVASQLYPQNPDQPSFAWVAYRDAVAQSGTGPALVNIKEWMQNNKINGREAAQVISTAAKSVRAPTEAHVKQFFQIIQDDQIMQKPQVNESALLAFTSLTFDVYGHRGFSHGEYPVYSFGSFRTSGGVEFVTSRVIPYLAEKLAKAITNADTHKIHAYIRAIGNVGQQQILEVFKPYLEGDKKASNFQRVLMVSALDRLVKAQPRVARSVLYKIYQNPSETDELRVAAVFLLMQTQPSADMLQRMASQTNVDTSECVNAAVKSSIESASKLQGSEQASLREAAQAARSLLTSEEYGIQHAQSHLRTYVTRETKLAYHQDVLSFGGDDHFISKGIKYVLHSEWGGVHSGIVAIQALVSSVDDLINVFERQTSEYQEWLVKKQKEKPQEQQWTSEYTAHTLGLDNDQREQLEGWLYGKLNRYWQEMISFDNHTIERIPQMVAEIESQLKSGKQFDYSRMINLEESALAVPTILGLPFIYSYDRPVLVRIQAEIKAESQPAISSNGQLHRPDSVKADFDIKSVISGRVQTQFGIVTPFNNQRYSAGYIKNFQLNVPLTGKLQLRLKNTPTFNGKQLQVELQNPVPQETDHLVHYSSWPYISQNEISATKPELFIIMSQNPHKISKVFGQKSTGVAVYLHATSDQIFDAGFLYNRLRNNDVMSALLNPWTDNNIQYVHVDVGIDAAKSTVQQINLHLGGKSEYQGTKPSSNSAPASPEEINTIPSFPEGSEQRQKEFLNKLGEQISNAHVFVVDATAEFHGQNAMKYSATAGLARSDVDPRSRFLGLVRKFEKQTLQGQAYVVADASAPNTNGLNMDYALKMDTTSTAFVQGLFQNQNQVSRAYATINLSKNQDRVNYLKQQLEYRECKRQMQDGNTQLPECAKMTAAANLLNQFSIKMKYHDMDPCLVNATYKAYSILRHAMYPRLEENILAHSQNNEFHVQGQFSPDLQTVNVSASTDYGNAKVTNVPLSRWTQKLLVPHPVFHLKSRLASQALKYDTYRPICVVDSSATSTLDNKTYPTSFSDKWTVVLQYVPRRPSSQKNKIDQSVVEQLIQQEESFIIYARAHGQSKTKKEISIVFQMPATEGKIARITMSPSRDGSSPKVYLNEQEVAYDMRHSSDSFSGNLQIYGLPNNEVKVELRNAFYVIFNGQTLKFTAVNSKFRGAARGLCGTFTDEEETEFSDPQNCILQDSRSFVESFTISNQDRNAKSRRRGQGEECYQKTFDPVHYISNQDLGRSKSNESSLKNRGSSCTKLQTKFQEQGNEICFTLRPMPSCKSGCASSATVNKNVSVHCKPASKSTDMWKAEILKGASPDFSSYPASRRISMQVPQSCKSAN